MNRNDILSLAADMGVAVDVVPGCNKPACTCRRYMRETGMRSRVCGFARVHENYVCIKTNGGWRNTRAHAGVMHELGHVAARHTRSLFTPCDVVVDQEFEAWEWAVENMGGLNPTQARVAWHCLLSYNKHFNSWGSPARRQRNKRFLGKLRRMGNVKSS